MKKGGSEFSETASHLLFLWSG
ncbi:MAG: hypothetical protein QOJ20_4344, partial [Mycobacterium sp.]|nr:hypothetical protein [Mycobacterium sp.]